MSFYCCGVKYSKNDPDTYWCIDTYINQPIQKKVVNNKKVSKEIVEVLTCKKNGCTKVQVKRYGKINGSENILEVEEFSRKKAARYLENTINIRVKQPSVCPSKKIPYAKKNDFKYGKAINSFTQRIRYLNEQGWASDKKIVAEVKTYKIS